MCSRFEAELCGRARGDRVISSRVIGQNEANFSHGSLLSLAPSTG